MSREEDFAWCLIATETRACCAMPKLDGPCGQRATFALEIEPSSTDKPGTLPTVHLRCPEHAHERYGRLRTYLSPHPVDNPVEEPVSKDWMAGGPAENDAEEARTERNHGPVYDDEPSPDEYRESEPVIDEDLVEPPTDEERDLEEQAYREGHA